MLTEIISQTPNLLVAQAEDALRRWIEPHMGCDLLSAGAVTRMEAYTYRLFVDVQLDFPAKRYQQRLQSDLQAWLLEHTQAQVVEISIAWSIPAPPQTSQSVPGVKHLIAVASGKGGVGKSTTTTNLALALAGEGARVGILDADLYGPSQPMLLGLSGLPDSHDGKQLEPMLGHGIQTMSIGFLVDEEAPVIWRGPMITQALGRLLNDTRWQDLDYLIIDMPPGTGDVHLTMAQSMPVSAAVIVTTPQDIALLDARKGLRMFEKVNVPVLGIVENMSTHVCSQCGHEEPIFGEGGASRMAAQCHTVLLGQLPLDIQIRMGADSGQPVLVADPDGALAETYTGIALRVAGRLAQLKGSAAFQTPKIAVD
jgi:ATP-binding protein involved in chromosome partitioning